MNSDQRMTLIVTLAATIALGAAIAGGIQVNRVLRGRSKRRNDVPEQELDQWEGEGGNVPSVPTPVPAATLATIS
jgi:hypothetical protein